MRVSTDPGLLIKALTSIFNCACRTNETMHFKTFYIYTYVYSQFIYTFSEATSFLLDILTVSFSQI